MQGQQFHRICVLIAVAMMAPTAYAQHGGKEADPCQAKPWYCGVSAEQQEKAKALHKEGNQLFADSLLARAAEKYRAALKHWDHPGIHYSLMQALMVLKKPLEAYESSIQALRYGAAPFEPEEYKLAMERQESLRGQIVELEISCEQSGAVVSLDGQTLFTGPGKVRHLTVPGQHEIIAKKKGFFTTNKTLALFAGKTSIELAMLPESKATLPERHWAPWKPLAVVGAGVGVSLLGSALQWRASESNRAFREQFNQECEAPRGCDADRMPSSEVNRLEDRELLYRRLSYGMYIVGGITTMAGVALVYVNRTRQVRNPEQDNLVRISLMPVLSPSEQGVALTMEY